VEVKKSLNDSRNRSGVAQKVPGSLGSQNPWYSAREFGEGNNMEVKVKIYSVTWHNGTEDGAELQFYSFFKFGVRWGWSSTPRPVLFPPE
jgi:hypothetical protein